MRVLLMPAVSMVGHLDRIVVRLHQSGIEVVMASAQGLDAPAYDDIDLIAGPGSMMIDGAVMDRFPRLRGLISAGVGAEGFDREAAHARSIPIVTGMSREAAAGMASATIMLMMALRHDLVGAMRAFAEGERRDSDRANPLDGATVGIVGYGNIGREVARRLRAWDIPVVVASPSAALGPLGNGAEGVSFAELLAISDIVTLHAAYMRGAPPILDRAALASMKAGALLVNTARGGLVDEEALAEQLTCGKLGGAALDCFADEPLPATSPLRGAPNTILTPHQIGHTAYGAEVMADRFAENIVRLAETVRAQPATQ